MKVQSISSAYNYPKKNVNFGFKNPITPEFLKKTAETAKEKASNGKGKLTDVFAKAAKKVSGLNLLAKVKGFGGKIANGAKNIAGKVIKLISTVLDKMESKFNPEKFNL